MFFARCFRSGKLSPPLFLERGLGGEAHLQPIRSTCLHRRKYNSPSAIRAGFRRQRNAVERHVNDIARVGSSVQRNAVATLQNHAIAIHWRGFQAAEIARDGRIDGLGNHRSTLHVGMQCVGQQFGMAVERRVQVDEANVGGGGNLSDSLLDGLVPVARASLETTMAVEDGRHRANPDFRLRIHGAKRVDQSAIVADEVVAVVRPVARVGVVQSEVDNHPIGLEIKGFLIFVNLRVGPMTAVEQRRTRVAEVPNVVLVAQQVL